MQKIIPCLWFNTQAEEAARLYCSVFPSSQISRISYYGDAAAEASGQAKGSPMLVEFKLEKEDFQALNGGPVFKLTPALSFFVWCKTRKEIDQRWEKLRKGGNVLMELQEYYWSKRYGWCEDKYGVSWQLMLSDETKPIAPAFLFMNTLLGQGEKAIHFYTSLFKNSNIGNIYKDPTSGAILHATFNLAGREFVLMEGEGPQKHLITPGMSFSVNCRDQDEVDYFWEKLSEGGATDQCGWLRDQFGISWQIVPTVLGGGDDSTVKSTT